MRAGPINVRNVAITHAPDHIRANSVHPGYILTPLTAVQDALLLRWGYPYVFGAWFFHMTLTRRLSTAEKDYWQPQAEAFFADAVRPARRVTDLCLFTQAAPGQDFTIAARIPLRG